MKDIIKMPDGSEYFIVHESRGYFLLKEKEVPKDTVGEVYDGYIIASVTGYECNKNLEVVYAPDYETARMVYRNFVGNLQLHKWKIGEN